MQDPVELKLFLLIMVKAGVDIFHVSTRRFWEPAFEGSNHSLAAWTKQISGKPVIAVGNAGINDPLTMEVFTGSVQSKATSIERVESGLKNDNFDLVAVGRALLADPDWPRKIATDRMSEVIPFSSDSLTS